MSNKKEKGTGIVLDTHNKVTMTELDSVLRTYIKEFTTNPDIAKSLSPIILWSAPGIGKSSIISEIAKDFGIELVDVRIAQLEPVDIRGLPSVDKDSHTMSWCQPNFWPTDKSSKGIIFLDELSSAPRESQVACYQLVLDRKIGDYKVPDGWAIIAAGNRLEDRAVSVAMSSALSNRFLHFELDANVEDWIKWALVHDINPSVTGFIQYRPELLFRHEGENLQRGWPSPRSWEKVSRMVDLFKNADESVVRKIVYGLVGNNAGVEFIEFHKFNRKLGNVVEMMTNQDAEIVIPTKLDEKYAFCSAVTYMLWRGKNEAEENARVDGFFRIMNNLTPDFASMMMMNAMEGSTKENHVKCINILFKHPSFADWQTKFGTAFKKRITKK